jgi:molybdenum cofactor cytidylyltransferase
MISAIIATVEDAHQRTEGRAFFTPNEKPLLQSLLQSVLATAVDEVICVSRDLARARRDVNLADRRLFWIWSPAGVREQSSLLITGLWASHSKSDGVMFVSTDQPLLDKQVLDALLTEFNAGVAWIVAATVGGEPRAPILFRRNLYPQLLTLKGNDTGQSLIKRHPLNTALVESGQPAGAQRRRSAKLAHLKERV